MEVVMKEGGGGDHVSVGVKKPRSRRIAPISRKNVYLRPPGRQNFSNLVFNAIYFSFKFSTVFLFHHCDDSCFCLF